MASLSELDFDKYSKFSSDILHAIFTNWSTHNELDYLVKIGNFNYKLEIIEHNTNDQNAIAEHNTEEKIKLVCSGYGRIVLHKYFNIPVDKTYSELTWDEFISPHYIYWSLNLDKALLVWQLLQLLQS